MMVMTMMMMIKRQYVSKRSNASAGGHAKKGSIEKQAIHAYTNNL